MRPRARTLGRSVTANASRRAFQSRGPKSGHILVRRRPSRST